MVASVLLNTQPMIASNLYNSVYLTGYREQF